VDSNHLLKLRVPVSKQLKPLERPRLTTASGQELIRINGQGRQQEIHGEVHRADQSGSNTQCPRLLPMPCRRRWNSRSTTRPTRLSGDLATGKTELVIGIYWARERP